MKRSRVEQASSLPNALDQNASAFPSIDSLGGDLMAAVFTGGFFSCIKTILPLRNKTETKLEARINLLESYLREYVTSSLQYLTRQSCRNYTRIIQQIGVISVDR